MKLLNAFFSTLLLAAVAHCQHLSNSKPTPATSSATARTDSVAVLVGAGDIASCDDLAGARATAKLLDNIPGTVFAAGDLAYPDGSDEDFEKCYGPTWGRFKDRTRPAPGNHEYHSDGASGYVRYFGAAAGDPKKGFYSYDLGGWHIIVLNSQCVEVGGCGPGSAQEQWLRQDLKAHPTKCTLAYWHSPLFSSGARHGDDPEVKPLWNALYSADVEIVINGHDHDYERFAPQDPNGKLDPGRGIREFVVGTGGKNSHRRFAAPKPNSEIRQADTFGVLKLTLHPTSYEWEFVPEAEKPSKTQEAGRAIRSDLKTAYALLDTPSRTGHTVRHSPLSFVSPLPFARFFEPSPINSGGLCPMSLLNVAASPAGGTMETNRNRSHLGRTR